MSEHETLTVKPELQVTKRLSFLAHSINRFMEPAANLSGASRIVTTDSTDVFFYLPIIPHFKCEVLKLLYFKNCIHEMNTESIAYDGRLCLTLHCTKNDIEVWKLRVPKAGVFDAAVTLFYYSVKIPHGGIPSDT